MDNSEELNRMSFMDKQVSEVVKCVHCWNKVSLEDISKNDSHCPRCDRHLDMDEDPYV